MLSLLPTKYFPSTTLRFPFGCMLLPVGSFSNKASAYFNVITASFPFENLSVTYAFVKKDWSSNNTAFVFAAIVKDAFVAGKPCGAEMPVDVLNAFNRCVVLSICGSGEGTIIHPLIS